MSIDFDFSDLNNFTVDIDQADAKLVGFVTKAVRISALKGKREWVGAARGHRYVGAYPTSIDYDDVHVTPDAIETELGPNLGKGSAGLGIVEDSPGGVRGAPQRNYEKAQKIIEEDLVKGVLQAVEDSIGGS